MIMNAIACYVAGVLVFPFFWSFATGCSVDDDEDPLWIFASVFWPVSLTIVLMYGWWRAVSILGSRARHLCGRARKDFERWTRGS